MNVYKRSKRRQWVEAALPRLGKENDSAIARDLNVTRRQIQYLRDQHNIKPLYQTRWDYKALQCVATEPAKQAAQVLGVSLSTVKGIRKSLEAPYERGKIPPEALDLLGKVPDAELAQRFGRVISTISAWRLAHGIAPVTVQRKWSAEEVKQLGTMPDYLLGRKLTRHASSVSKKRQSLGISPYKA